MKDRSLVIGSGALLTAVVLGAFGAHALKSRLDVDDLAVWRTGVEYQFYHGIGLLLIGGLRERIGASAVQWAGRCLLFGIVLFSGSLYLLSTKDLMGTTEWIRWIGPITPLGGALFIAGWAIVLRSALRR
ncbi:MAG: DUF423 domain-containing protein [Flavobacteriales bacterium]|nr:DUF423 domain-containing protein [Flavobacteriales bacterium]